MSEDFIKVGRIGRVHGLRGELKFSAEEDYIEDIIKAQSFLVRLGGQYIPYFVEYLRTTSLLKLEEVDDKELATLLQHKDVFLPATSIEQIVEPEADTPYEDWIGYTIVDEKLGELGKITAIVDLPQHYLAEVLHGEKTIVIPLHDDLIVGLDVERKALLMELPEGILEL